jgi:hypothetical protein
MSLIIRVNSFGFLAITLIALLGFSCQNADAQLSDSNFDSPFANADLVPWAGTGLTTVDKWAAEAAQIVGTDNGVTPVEGDQMAKLLDDGSAFTEIKQRVGSIGLLTDAQVDTGAALALYFAHLNTPASAPVGATVQILLQFLDGSQNALGLPVAVTSSPLDNDPNTWELVQMDDVPVPAGSRGAEAIIRYDVASLTSIAGFVPGYIDSTHLGFSFVPEPSTLGLLVLCGMWKLANHRKGRRS